MVGNDIHFNDNDGGIAKDTVEYCNSDKTVNEDTSSGQIEVDEITYKEQKYYKDDQNNIYKFEENEYVGPVIGKMINNEIDFNESHDLT